MNNDAIDSARRMVERAQRMVQEAEFDPGTLATKTDVERLTPWNRLLFVTLFVRKLQLANELVRNQSFLPDPQYANSEYRFKANDDVMVSYLGDNPLWHVENCGEHWGYFRLRFRMSSIADPRREPPERLLRNVARLTKRLEGAVKKVEGQKWGFPNPLNPDSEYAFGVAEGVVVAYKESNPIWHLERAENEWKLYKLEIHIHPNSLSSLDNLPEDVLEEIHEFFVEFGDDD